MTVIQDIKELPKDEPKLQKYSLYSLGLSAAVAVCMIIWYFARFNRNSEGQMWWGWQVLHLLAYGAYLVLVILALIGAYYPKPHWIGWYLIGTLILLGSEAICLIFGIIIAKKENRFEILTIIGKVLALTVFGVTAVFAYCWKRYLDGRPSKQNQMADKNDEKMAAVKNAIKEGSKSEGKAESSKSDKNKSKA